MSTVLVGRTKISSLMTSSTSNSSTSARLRTWRKAKSSPLSVAPWSTVPLKSLWEISECKQDVWPSWWKGGIGKNSNAFESRLNALAFFPIPLFIRKVTYHRTALRKYVLTSCQLVSVRCRDEISRGVQAPRPFSRDERISSKASVNADNVSWSIEAKYWVSWRSFDV